jgi:hypothetical protein
MSGGGLASLPRHAVAGKQTSKNLQEGKGSMDRRKKKLIHTEGHIHQVEYYSALKRNGI